MAQINGEQNRGLLRVVPPEGVTAMENADQRREPSVSDAAKDGLAGHIRGQWETMKRHRNGSRGWNERLAHAMRVFNGKYDVGQLQDIQQFGGSTIYARVVAVKCRGATAMLRDVYLGADRPWQIDPTPNPTLPDNIKDNIFELVQGEVAGLAEAGQPIDEAQVRDRVEALYRAADLAAKKEARLQAATATERVDDVLIEGAFYKALAEFLVDLPLFPFACIKGPIVRVVPSVKWEKGKAVISSVPKMFWERVSPFDIWWTPGITDIADGAIIERKKLSRADLNELLDLPGYDQKALRKVLEEYNRGYVEAIDTTDGERTAAESREDPNLNESELIDCLEWHGPVQGKHLIDLGWSKRQVSDPLRDVFVQAWVIGRHVIKVQLAPSPRKRHPYFITSFEKVPGTVVGNGLPDILADIQDVCNASLRALVNNLSISSGPQVVINADRLLNSEDSQSLYPWKRWEVTDSESGNNTEKPIDFFQPASNAQELLGVYEKFTQIADELSAVPRFTTGSNPGGGAGRTASGLAMLMGNASKILQTVALNVDRDVFEPLLTMLYDMLMLTDRDGTLRGDESINVRGVQVALQRETERQRQVELLQATANPMDAEIMGKRGRANLLRAVANTTGLVGEQIVPSDDELAQAEKESQQAAAAAAAAAQGGAPGVPGGAVPPGAPPIAAQAAQAQGAQSPPAAPPSGPRTNLQQQTPRPPAIGLPS